MNVDATYAPAVPEGRMAFPEPVVSRASADVGPWLDKIAEAHDLSWVKWYRPQGSYIDKPDVLSVPDSDRLTNKVGGRPKIFLSFDSSTVDVMQVIISCSWNIAAASHASIPTRPDAASRDGESRLVIEASNKSIDRLVGLPDNWNGIGGEMPRAEYIILTKELVKRLAPYLAHTPFFYPALHGGIVIEVCIATNRLTIILEGNFLLAISFVDGHHETQEFDTTNGVSRNAIKWLGARLHNLAA